MQIILRGPPALLFVPPAEGNVLQVPEILLQVIVDLLRISLEMLQVKVYLQHIDVDLQQNSGSAWLRIERRVPIGESGEPGIREMLQVSPDLQQINLGVLQI